MYNRGINQEAEILDLAVKEGIIEKAGAWYAFKGSKIGQGKSNACQFLAENKNDYLDIERQLKVKLLQASTREPVDEAPSVEQEEQQEGVHH